MKQIIFTLKGISNKSDQKKFRIILVKNFKLSLVFLTLLLFFQIKGYGTVKNEPRFLFQNGNVLLSGFGGVLSDISIVDNNLALYSGGGGAFLINQKLWIGGFGLGLTSRHFREDLKNIVDIDKPKLIFKYGGLWIGYIHKYYNPFHISVSLKAGGGQIALVDEYFHYTPFDDRKAVDKVFVISPAIELEINCTSWMKTSIGIGYRYVGGIDRAYRLNINEEPVQYYDQNTFNYPYLRLGFLFGWFDQSK